MIFLYVYFSWAEKKGLPKDCDDPNLSVQKRWEVFMDTVRATLECKKREQDVREKKRILDAHRAYLREFYMEMDDDGNVRYTGDD